MKKQIVLWGGADRRLASWKFPIVFILGTVLNAFGLAGQTTPFFSVLSLSDAQLTPDQLLIRNSYQQWPHMKSIHIVQLTNPLMAQSGQIALQVPGDTTTYTFTATHVEAYSSGDFVWYGDMTSTSHPDEADLSDDGLSGLLSLIAKNGQTFGEMRIDTIVFHIPYLGDGLNALVKFSVQDFNTENICISDGDAPLPAPPDPEEPESSCPVVRVLALYTDLAKHKVPGIEGTIENAHATARQALLNSAVNLSKVDLRLVAIERLPSDDFAESGVWNDDEIIILAANSKARQLKSLHQADVVMIFTDDVYEDFNGKVFAFGDFASAADSAFAWVEVQHAGSPNYTYAHEMGHLFGARHQRHANCTTNFDDSGLPHAHAFAFQKGRGGIFTKFYRTVVSPCKDNGKRIVIQHYSNPDVEFKKRSTGASDANNARVFRDAVCRIAGYVPSPDIRVDFVGPGTICDGETVTFQSTVSGILGPYFYQWRYKFGTGAWSGIISTENLTLTVPPNAQGFLYVELTAGNAAEQSVATKSYKIVWCLQDPLVPRSTQAGRFAANLSPNPASTYLQVRLTEPTAAATNVGVFNVLGELCLSTVLSFIDHPTSQFQVGLPDLPNGQYILSLQSAGRSESIRFSILK